MCISGNDSVLVVIQIKLEICVIMTGHVMYKQNIYAPYSKWMTE